MKKILIIDDNEAFTSTLSDSLPKDKYTAVIAGDGIEGMEKLKTEKPDLIILDMKMPRMDGITFLKELRKENIPVKILISSELSGTLAVSNAIAEGMDLGITGYIAKSSESLEMTLKEIDNIFAKG